MIKVTSVEDLKEKTKKGLSLIYFKTKDCGICKVDKPIIDKICKAINVFAYEADIEEISLLKGIYEIFTVPAVILSFDNKELYRAVRIINFDELADKMKKYKQLSE